MNFFPEINLEKKLHFNFLGPYNLKSFDQTRIRWRTRALWKILLFGMFETFEEEAYVLTSKRSFDPLVKTSKLLCIGNEILKRLKELLCTKMTDSGGGGSKQIPMYNCFFISRKKILFLIRRKPSANSRPYFLLLLLLLLLLTTQFVFPFLCYLQFPRSFFFP